MSSVESSYFVFILLHMVKFNHYGRPGHLIFRLGVDLSTGGSTLQAYNMYGKISNQREDHRPYLFLGYGVFYVGWGWLSKYESQSFIA